MRNCLRGSTLELREPRNGLRVAPEAPEGCVLRTTFCADVESAADDTDRRACQRRFSRGPEGGAPREDL
eukprot:1671985-Alexandrium_andersonii.AAC.1